MSSYSLGSVTVWRVGFGAMQLPRPGVLGPPRTAQRLGHTRAQVALAWLLSLRPNILLIPGTSSVRHLEENFAVSDIELDQQAQDELTAAA